MDDTVLSREQRNATAADDHRLNKPPISGGNHMAEIDGLIAQIGEEDGYPGSLPAKQLSEFLYFFRAAYNVVALDMYEKLGEAIERFSVGDGAPVFDFAPFQADAASRALHNLLPRMRGFHRTDLYRLTNVDLEENELGITYIRYNSPLQLAFAGIPIALTAAVILSGGEFRLGGMVRVKLPPIGAGIQKLREAFGQRQPRQRKPRKKRAPRQE